MFPLKMSKLKIEKKNHVINSGNFNINSSR